MNGAGACFSSYLSTLILFALSNVHALVITPDFYDVRTCGRNFHAGVVVVQRAHGNHLPLHVHDGETIGCVRRVCRNRKFEGASLCNVECRSVVCSSLILDSQSSVDLNRKRRILELHVAVCSLVISIKRTCNLELC